MNQSTKNAIVAYGMPCIAIAMSLLLLVAFVMFASVMVELGSKGINASTWWGAAGYYAATMISCVVALFLLSLGFGMLLESYDGFKRTRAKNPNVLGDAPDIAGLAPVPYIDPSPSKKLD